MDCPAERNRNRPQAQNYEMIENKTCNIRRGRRHFKGNALTDDSTMIMPAMAPGRGGRISPEATSAA